jgi:diacylglycerol kinase family enzyme
MASVGFDAYSLKQINNSSIKKTVGIFAYILGAVKAFFNYSFPQLDVSIENRVTEKGTFVLISNTSHYGRYFKITPFANPFDGMLDVIIYKKKGRLNFLRLLLGVLWNTITGNHENNHYFFSKANSFYRTTSLKIKSSSGNLFYQLDGDHFLSRELSLSIKKKSLNVILPKKTIKKFLKPKSKKKNQ